MDPGECACGSRGFEHGGRRVLAGLECSNMVPVVVNWILVIVLSGADSWSISYARS